MENGNPGSRGETIQKEKETSNNNGNDEIQYGTNKTKYVTLKLKGDSVDYKVSLTKKSEKR